MPVSYELTYPSPYAGSPYYRRRLSMIDLLDKIACFVKRKNIFSLSKAAT
jgi:hypothetical protein